MLPEEDRRALKKNGYNISAKGVISPIAHPLQTPNRKSSSSAAQLHRQGERNPLNDSRPIQPKATPTTSNTRRYGSADAAERWSAGSNPKPKPTPNLRGMSADAAERWSAGLSLKPKPKATPTALNTRRYGSADAAERWSAGSSPQAKPKPNLRGMSPDAAERWTSGSTPKPQLAIAPLGQQPAKNRPLTPPAPEPPKPEPEKSWWDKARDSVTEKASDAWDKTKSVGTFVKDHAEDFGHGALDVVGLVPVVGDAVDLAHAGWYLAEGDKVNAALSAASAIPFVGDAAKVGKYGAKAVKGAEKLAEAGAVKVASPHVEQALNPKNVALAERYKAQLAQQEIQNAPATGSALKPDAAHRAASFVTDTTGQGKHFTFKDTDFPFLQGDGKWKNLTQVEGNLNGKKGIYEYIVDSKGNLTHQFFIYRGRITGFPNQKPGK
jgi:hypothetical protein